MQTFNAAQNYAYSDSMNRLDGASETGSWSDTHVYDCMNNMALTGTSGSAQVASSFTPQTTDPSSCVIGVHTPPVPFDANNHWNGAVYDSAGDTTGVSTQSMYYDGERRLIKLTDTGTNPATTVTYGYDADGRRVVKTTSSGTTIYVYGPDGTLAGESTTMPYTSAGTEYVTADQLGSTRLTTNTQGYPVGCHDYFPFGLEIPSSLGGRNALGCYTPTTSDTTLRFTGQVRDGDTSPGLDFFGARYMSSAQGRFTSPDPLLNSGRPWQPQYMESVLVCTQQSVAVGRSDWVVRSG